MPRNSSGITVMKCEIKKLGFLIRFFPNSDRKLNIIQKLKIAVFSLSRTKVHGKIIFLMNRYETRTKVHGKIIFLMNRYETVNEHQIT